MAAVVTLKYPIKANGQVLEELTLERPRVKHLKAADGAKGEMEKTALLISELAGIPPSSVDQIDAADFAQLAEVIGGFFEQRPATGAPSAQT